MVSYSEKTVVNWRRAWAERHEALKMGIHLKEKTRTELEEKLAEIVEQRNYHLSEARKIKGLMNNIESLLKIDDLMATTLDGMSTRRNAEEGKR